MPNVFEHIDAECQDWPDRSEDPPGLGHIEIRNLYEPGCDPARDPCNQPENDDD